MRVVSQRCSLGGHYEFLYLVPQLSALAFLHRSVRVWMTLSYFFVVVYPYYLCTLALFLCSASVGSQWAENRAINAVSRVYGYIYIYILAEIKGYSDCKKIKDL